MEEKFDIKALQSRIAEVKKENEVSTLFTQEFLKCLLKRHDLQNILGEDHEFDDVPEIIVEALKKGEIPTEEQLSVMDVETQDYLLKDCIYMCGLAAISWYSDNAEEYAEMDPKPFDYIITMVDISPGHHTASYIIAALTLIMGDIPSEFMIDTLTNEFDNSEEQLQKNLELFNEICLSILKRYQEDQEYYV